MAFKIMEKPKNLLLQKLSDKPLQDLLKRAEYVHFDLRDAIYESGVPIAHVDFPEDGVMSIVESLSDGSEVEVLTVGYEGLVGVQVILGIAAVKQRAFCQVVGSSWRVKTADYLDLLREYDELAIMSKHYLAIMLDISARNIGCNRGHSIDARCARWLLHTRDRCKSDKFGLTQEFLACMLGVSRGGVNIAAGELSKAGLISYSRGQISVLDRAGLEKMSCECYFKSEQFRTEVLS